MLTPKEADLFFRGLSGRTCDLSYENGQLVLRLTPGGETVFVRLHNDIFSVTKSRIIADYVIGHEDESMGCTHPKEYVEPIAQKEYPGSSVLWCRWCGAVRDEDSDEWELPTNWMTTRAPAMSMDSDDQGES